MASYSYFNSFWTSHSDGERGGTRDKPEMDDMKDLTRSLPAVSGQANAEAYDNNATSQAGIEGFGDDVKMEETDASPALLPAAVSQSREDELRGDDEIAGAQDVSTTNASTEDADANSHPEAGHPWLQLEADSANGLLATHEPPNDGNMDTTEDAISPTSPMSTASTAVNSEEDDFQTRQELYAERFSNKVLPLAQLREPNECSELPQYKAEIIEAYLRSTTFTVQIWTNFDAADYQFYTDRRAEDCGKLRLANRVRTRLEALDWKTYRVRNLRLQIGTPFRPLAEIDICIPTTDAEVYVEGRALFWFEDGPPDWLYPFLEHCIDRIRASFDASKNRRGLKLTHLDNLAATFRRSPTWEDARESVWYCGEYWDLWAEEVAEEEVEDSPMRLRSGVLNDWFHKGG